MMLLIIAVGYIVSKCGIVSSKSRLELIDIVMYIVLPCNIFTSFQKGMSMETLKQCAVVLIAATVVQFAYLALNHILFRRSEHGRRAVMRYAILCNNAGFLGLPVIGAVFGATGLIYGSVVLIPHRIFSWTSGLSLFTKSTSRREVVKTIMTHPCIWAVILGFAYIFAPFTLPGFVTDTLFTIGDCITALTMLIVGMILSEVDPKTVSDRDCFIYSAIRLIAIPAAVLGVMLLIGADAQVTGVLTLSTAMPAAVTTVMLASKYEADAAFASKLLFVSTVLSMVTLPIVTLFFQ